MNVQPHLLNLSAYINQNLEKDLPLSSLAKRVGLSPFHFHRKFGAYFGESLHQHIKRLRLERAAFALINGSTPVRQIARESGYKTVSAFSHAFSGFSGESPTRYRSLGSARQSPTSAHSLEPSWIGDLTSQPFAFVRAKCTGATARDSIREAIDGIEALCGADAEGREAPAPRPPPFSWIAATSDLYGVSTGGEFRVDVGLDATEVPAGRASALGTQTLPGGRYARFDFRCRPDEVADGAIAAALNGLGDATPRLGQYFLRFDVEHDAAKVDGKRDYRFFVPLTD